MMSGTAYDFIVVGGKGHTACHEMLILIANPGGTAGCCVAGRLAENPNVSVLVIEAGIAYGITPSES